MTSNYIDATGLRLQSLTDIVTELENGFKSIYGADINLDANSPDSQMINLFAQAKIDILDTISQVYQSFSPSSASGRVLDQRCAINGVVRQGATNTVIQVVVTTDRVVNLVGGVFTVADSQGTQFVLIDNQTTTIGANTYLFQAVDSGKVIAVNNTVTTIVTITLGVLSVNNPNDTITQGVDQETDAELKVRRQRSVALPSSGYLEGLQAGLEALNNVSHVAVYENTQDITDVYGTPGHTMWAVVDGGDNQDIADVIYTKRNAGCGMRGDVIVTKSTPIGFNMPIRFDRPTYVDLWINLTVTSIEPGHLIDDVYLETELFNRITYGIYQPADYTEITSLIKELDQYAVVTTGGVSLDNITYAPFLYPPTLAGRFVLSTTRINITVI